MILQFQFWVYIEELLIPLCLLLTSRQVNNQSVHL